MFSGDVVKSCNWVQMLKGCWVCLFCPVLVLITSCQQIPVERNAVRDMDLAGAGEPQWWRVSFELAWDKHNPPAWFFGPLLADQVISPILKSNEQNIILWRFHRRAAADTAGHRFTFLCFTNKTVFSVIKAEINGSLVLQKLLLSKQVLAVNTGNVGGEGATMIDATSDKNWSPAMQKTWPYFLMGSSKMWLEQVKIAAEAVESDMAVDWGEAAPLVERYQRVHQEVSRHWIYEGQHALFHHLGALYGYQPINLLQRF